MSKRIRSMIDGIFSEMKMTAENLALRDELMDNALSRYADAISQGRSEEEAFAEVASSLEDVQGLLDEMNRMDAQPGQKEPEETVPELETGTEPQEEYEAEEATKTDLSDALNKAFSALGDFSHAIVPEAKKLVKEVDGVTGGVLSKLGRAARKGMHSAKKAAGETRDKISKGQGELVFDFGAKKQEEKEEPVSEFYTVETEQPEPQEDVPEAVLLREQAKDLRAEAAIKDVTGDPEGAQALIDRACELEARADLLEQTAAVEAACAAAQEAEALILAAEKEDEETAQEDAEEAMQETHAPEDAAQQEDAFCEQPADDDASVT